MPDIERARGDEKEDDWEGCLSIPEIDISVGLVHLTSKSLGIALLF